MPNIVVPPKHEMTPGRDWRTDESALPRSDFSVSDWTVLKAAGRLVAAKHNVTGEMRKLPKGWFS